jgi:hypothetical protein
MANGKTPKIAGPKMPRAAGMPKMPARMPAAPRMAIGGTPNVAGRATRAPRAPRMGNIKP